MDRRKFLKALAGGVSAAALAATYKGPWCSYCGSPWREHREGGRCISCGGTSWDLYHPKELPESEPESFSFDSYWMGNAPSVWSDR